MNILVIFDLPEDVQIGFLPAPDINIEMLLAVVTAQHWQRFIGTDDELVSVAVS